MSGPTHRTCEAIACRGVPLDDADQLRQALGAAAEAGRATVVGSAEHAYHGGGGGLTMVLLCAESHVLVSTWPEADYALVEVFLCGGDANVAAATDAMRSALAPGEWRVHDAPVRPPTLGA